jgi:aryl-alcohol dehydrogenase-like predicted oxidoreductase
MADIVLGALLFGTRIDETDSMAILDRFVERGGRWIDTANNYAFWLDPGGVGGQSEALIGRWLAARPGMRDRVRISTKLGAQPTVPGTGLDTAEGLSAPVVRRAVEESLTRLGVEHIDLYWAHIEDRSVPLAQTVEALGDLATRGVVGRLGASNHPAWRVEQARQLAEARGVPGYSALQLRHSYLRPRPGAPLPEWAHRQVSEETLDYVRSNKELTLWAYTTLLNGSYTQRARPLGEAYDHPGTTRRLAALTEVAHELGATSNQVVLSWLLGGDPVVFPIIGASTVARIDEAMDALDLKLDADVRRRLDEPA